MFAAAKSEVPRIHSPGSLAAASCRIPNVSSSLCYNLKDGIEPNTFLLLAQSRETGAKFPFTALRCLMIHCNTCRNIAWTSHSNQASPHLHSSRANSIRVLVWPAAWNGPPCVLRAWWLQRICHHECHHPRLPPPDLHRRLSDRRISFIRRHA